MWSQNNNNDRNWVIFPSSAPPAWDKVEPYLLCFETMKPSMQQTRVLSWWAILNQHPEIIRAIKIARFSWPSQGHSCFCLGLPYLNVCFPITNNNNNKGCSGPSSTLRAALEVGWGLDIPGASVEKGSRGTQNAIIEG